MSERIRAIGAIREHGNILLFGKTPKQKRVVTDNVIATIFRDIATPRLIEQQKGWKEPKLFPTKPIITCQQCYLLSTFLPPMMLGSPFCGAAMRRPDMS